MKFFECKYRVTRDAYLGFEIQQKRWFFPFWTQMNFANTYRTLDDAIKAIPGMARAEVWRGNIADAIKKGGQE